VAPGLAQALVRPRKNPLDRARCRHDVRVSEPSTALPLPADSAHAAGEGPPVQFPFRAVASAELIDRVTEAYELDWTGESTDVGGAINLNLALSDRDGPAYVLRVYAAPWTSVKRVRFIQTLRSHLRESGLPFPATLVTKRGQGVVEVAGLVAEIECYVDGTKWDARRQLGPGLALLGRVHAEMARATSLGDQPPGWWNHVEAEQALDWAERAADVVRSWEDVSSVELALPADFVRLAEVVRPLEAEFAGTERRQLVHGDFWEQTVLFDADGHATAVLDLDFCGSCPRLDDLAYTLSGTGSLLDSPTVDVAHWESIQPAVDAYSDAVTPPLSSEERRALPLAIARGVLCVARQVVEGAALGEAAGFTLSFQREYLRRHANDLAWSLALAQDPAPIQAVFTG
jgi:homoserine kinase type II